jgi:hypothetical protein
MRPPLTADPSFQTWGGSGRVMCLLVSGLHASPAVLALLTR